MPDATSAGRVLLVGAGNLGGALLAGWRRRGVEAGRILIRDPKPSESARQSAAAGAALNPPDDALAGAGTMVFAVKPQGWVAAAEALEPLLDPQAVVVSVLAGVKGQALSEAFGGRRVARVMPTTAIAIARGVATLHAADPAALARAHVLFDPVATTVDLDDEGLMEAAVGVSGSAPAYLYAFTEALAAAGEKAGLPGPTAARLARATMESAAALMAESEAEPAELRRQVTSPRGATEAALDVLLAADGLPTLLRRAVQAAADRARALSQEGGAGRG